MSTYKGVQGVWFWVRKVGKSMSRRGAIPPNEKEKFTPSYRPGARTCSYRIRRPA